MSEEAATATAQDTTQAVAPTEAAEKPAEGTTQVPPGEAEPVESEKVQDAGSEKEAKDKAPDGKQAVPEKYELKLPEGSQLRASRIEDVAAYAKEQGLSNEQAQALVERESAAVADYAKAQEEALKARTEAWASEVQSDKEIGGDKFKENVELAHRVLKRYGSESFNEVLRNTGMGDYPELVRVFVRIGKEMAPDRLVIPGAESGGQVTREKILYPNLK